MAKRFLSDGQLKSKCSFPLPAKTSFRDGKRSQDAILGWEYLEALSAELAAIARCRVYRLDPPVDMRLIGKSTTDIEVWEGPIKFPSGEYERYFYHTFGAGSYKVIVEEQGLSGVVCDIWFTLPDRDGYPPKIDDRTLQVDHPAAKNYIDWRALRGDPVIGTKEEPQENGGDDFFMDEKKPGTAGTAQTLVEGLLDLSKSQIGRAEKEAEAAKLEVKEAREKGSNDSSPGVMAQAASAAIGIVQETAKEAMKNSHAPDPVEMIKAIIEFIPKPAPPPDNAPMFNAMMSMQQESNKTILTMVMNQNSELKQELAAMRSPQNVVAPIDPLAKIKEIKEYAELLGWKSGAGSSAPAEPELNPAQFMEKWGPLITMGMTMLNPIIARLFPLPAAPAQVQPVQQYEQPQPAVVQQPQQPPPDPNSQEAIKLRLLQFLEKPFLAHFQDADLDGFTFAQWVISDGTMGAPTTKGRGLYMDIKTNLGMRPDGGSTLDDMIKGFPPIWDIAKNTQPQYRKFLAEFFHYDEMQAEQVGSAKAS